MIQWQFAPCLKGILNLENSSSHHRSTEFKHMQSVTDRWMDGVTDRWMERWMDGCTDNSVIPMFQLAYVGETKH